MYDCGYFILLFVVSLLVIVVNFTLLWCYLCSCLMDFREMIYAQITNL